MSMCSLQIFKIPPSHDVYTPAENIPLKIISEGRKCIISHLGKTLGRYSKQIICDILAVDCGIKPSFLFDYGCVKAKQVISLIQDLQTQQLLSTSSQPCSYIVLAIEGDVLLCNTAILQSHLLQTSQGTRTAIIDISKSNSQAKLLENINQVDEHFAITFQQIIASFSDSKETCEVQFPASLNLTTLVGVLLGYPIVYWFSRSNEDDSNSLVIDSLTVFKLNCHLLCRQCHSSQEKSSEIPIIKNEQKPLAHNNLPLMCLQSSGEKLKTSSCKCNETITHCIYSYSVPEALTSMALSYVESWIQDINHFDSWQKCYHCLQLHQNIVYAPEESYSISF
ncbi:UPF0739 protein C1orf74 homolog [Octopus sinensis]|uniref:UPF0739 protein C1orf74 homolog n=1 Tax=Octopus sinensis TaxID=2607531 RepID=A0A6P7SMG8_9MOLL|nr:UPF0739 protein C1orf74 homolog [Octopus sinensis]